MATEKKTKTSTIHAAKPNSTKSLEEGLIMEDVALEPPAALKQLGEAINGVSGVNEDTVDAALNFLEPENGTETAEDAFSTGFTDLEIDEKSEQQPLTPTTTKPACDTPTAAPSDEGLGPIGIFDSCPNTPGGASTLDGTTISSIGSASARRAMMKHRQENQLRDAQREAQKEIDRMQVLKSEPSSTEESNSLLQSESDVDSGNFDGDDDETQVAGVAKPSRKAPAVAPATTAETSRFCSFLSPRRKFEVAAVLLSLLAFVLTGIATDRCDFVQVANDDLQNYWELPDRNVGLVQFETITAECTYWFNNPNISSSFYDVIWHTARILSVAATALGFLLVGFICTLSCISYRAVVMQRAAFGSLIIPLLYGMSFIIFGSDMCETGTCNIGIGGLLMVLGITVWFILAIILFMIPESNNNQSSQASGAAADTATETAIRFQRNRILLLVAIIMVVASIVVVNVSVFLVRLSGDGSGRDEIAPLQSVENDLDTQWHQTGETAMGPYPDSPSYVALSGDAKVMSILGKESVLVMDYDETKGLWYPFGDMIPANWDSKGWEFNDRVTKVRGTSASLSEDGRAIAVGSSNWASNAGQNYEFGLVQVWRYDDASNRWLTKGHPISGRAKDDSFGSKVAISDDGRRLAILAGGHFEKLKPYVRVYQYNDVLEDNGNWVQVGPDMELEASWVPSGFAFSGDGSTVALGSLRVGRMGLVTVWQYDEAYLLWRRQGTNIGSETSSRENKFGESIALSDDGSVVVVGDPGSASGYAQVLSLTGGEWRQFGQNLECTAKNGECARDVAISNQGSIVAVAGYDVYQTVTVYYVVEGQDQWEQLGLDIVSAEPKEAVQHTAIDISNNGQSIALGITSQETMTHVWRYSGESFSDVPLKSSASADSSNQDEDNPFPESPSAEIETVSSESTNTSGSIPLASDLESFEVTSAPIQSNDTGVSDEASAPMDPEVLQPWTQATDQGDIFYSLFGSVPQIKRYDMSTRQFLPAIILPTEHGSATAFGVGQAGQLYVAYGSDVFKYDANGSTEENIMIEAKAPVVDFQFDNDFVFINAGRFVISVHASTNELINEFYSNNEFVQGASISDRHKRLFGRTQDETASGGIISPSDLVFKEYNDEGAFVKEKITDINEEAGVKTATRTWLFPDQTRLVDDEGYVFSVATGEFVYWINTEEIIDVAWLGGDHMITLHANGHLTSISPQLVSTGNMTLDFTPSKLAVTNGETFAFAFDETSEHGIRVDSLGFFGPTYPESLLDPKNVPFVPEFPFIHKNGDLYMMSKAHASIFVMTPAGTSHSYTESIKLSDIPNFVAYSSTNNEIYTYRESGVLSKISLANENKTEVEIARLSETPLALSTAGKFIFVVEKSGAFATHHTFWNNGTLVSSVGNNHIDDEYVWSQANQKMFFFRQANPTDLMSEHIFENGTIGMRVDSFLNNNSGFEHPVRVDPQGRHVVLGSGIVHNARTLERLDIKLANRVHDIAFAGATIRTIRSVGDNAVQLQQWNGTSLELLAETHVPGVPHRILALDESTTAALTTDVFGRPVVYRMDADFNVA